MTAASAIRDQKMSYSRQSNPNTFIPPSTDHGEVPTFWNSFSTAHRRIQEGGWSRQVTVADFPLSKDIAGVNMRLTAGGIRELHWHDAAEWSIMLSGDARITAIDNDGKHLSATSARTTYGFFHPALLILFRGWDQTARVCTRLR